jgi:hypothetical protein
LRVRSHIHQLGLNVQAVTPLDHFPSQHRPHIQLAADFFGICFVPLVTKYVTSWHDTQRRDLREAVDQVFRDAVAEILGVGVGTDVDEGEHREGVDRAACRGSCGPQSPDDDESKQYQHSSRDGQEGSTPCRQAA